MIPPFIVNQLSQADQTWLNGYILLGRRLKHKMISNNIETHSQVSPSFNKIPSLVQNHETGWKRLVKDIVRPPRSIYSDKDLGSRKFILNQTAYQREDMDIIHESKKIVVTLYEPAVKNQWLILYLHGNSSSRFEATGLLSQLPSQFSLAAFDFLGCGLNEQTDSVSLGHRQTGQVQSIVQQLQKRKFKIVIWGRSMGAATALKYGKGAIIVADSSFKSFKSLCKQMAMRHSPNYLPSCLISCLFPCAFYKLRSDVKQTAHYDIEALNVLEAVQKINTQTFLIFMSGDADLLIDKRNSEILYEAFPGKKKHLQIFPGTHNTRRPLQVQQKIMKMIGDYVKQLEDKPLQSMSKAPTETSPPPE